MTPLPRLHSCFRESHFTYTAETKIARPLSTELLMDCQFIPEIIRKLSLRSHQTYVHRPSHNAEFEYNAMKNHRGDSIYRLGETNWYEPPEFIAARSSICKRRSAVLRQYKYKYSFISSRAANLLCSTISRAVLLVAI